ncbi:MAG: YihY/virulence factor BrkB family protein [Roseivirga sp.]|nr:YihY/virulence factor BrkB family protein [Roseivirga sp.]
MLQVLKNTFSHFSESEASQKAAALAYYTVFSMLPMIVIIISVLGAFWGKQAVAGEIYLQLKDILGDTASLQIQEVVKNQHVHYNSSITCIIGFVTLFFSASGMFNQVHTSFNGIWNIKERPKNGVIRYLTKNLSSILILMLLFSLILISTSINSLLIKYSKDLHTDYMLLNVYEHIVSFVMIALIFFLMFKSLGDAKVNWKAALSGGVFTTLMFFGGKILIGLYIGHSHTSTVFGSASVLALIMLWVYYISQIVFLGASFVKVMSDKLGLQILPIHHAVKVEHREVDS